jgi:uncharacterized protein (DUF1778 family)
MSAQTGAEDVLSDQARWAAALRLLQEALNVLDDSDAPPEIGAQLSMAINRLERAIHRSVQRSS